MSNMSVPLCNEEIFQKIFDNEPIDNLSEELTFNIIKFMENNIKNYGYKNKKAQDYFYYLTDYGDSNIVYKYFTQIFSTNYEYYLNFSTALATSDLIFYNNEFFDAILRNKENINLLLKKSSFKVVTKVLKKIKIFHKLKNKKDFCDDEIFLSCVSNSDDRVFKLVLGLVTPMNLENCLRIMVNTKPKYFLKRVKMLNKKIQLDDYFDKMLYVFFDRCFSWNELPEWKKAFIKIIKIYQKKNVDFKKSRLNLSVFFGDECYDFYQELKDCCYPKLLNFFNHIILRKLSYIGIDNLKVITEILDRTSNVKFEVVKNLISYIDFCKNNDEVYYKFVRLIQRKYRKEIYQNFANKFFSNYRLINFYGNYFSPHPSCIKLIKINLVKSFLRIKLAKIAKINKNSMYNKRRRLIKELYNFKPYSNIPVLVSGSRNYQVINQSFHSMRPPSMFTKKIANEFGGLISLKVDGVQINRLPSSIKNPINKLVKAENIVLKNEQNLFLVFDVNIPGLTYLERIVWLRDYHYLNLPPYYHASNLSDLLVIFKKEYKYEQQWLSMNKNVPFTWYPKAFIKYQGNLEEINQMVFNNQFNPPYLSYPIDGIIVNVNGKDYKMKPKRLHTIDLKYNKKWYDSGKETEYEIINPYEIELKNNTIYRCYPETDNTYVVKEERYDKTRPNSSMIIKDIRESYFQNDNSYYRKPVIPSKVNLKEIKESRENELSFLKSLNLSKSSKILDLCCGKGNVSRILSGFYKYTLIDKCPLVKDCKDNYKIISADLNSFSLGEYKNYIWICLNGIWYWKENFIKNLIEFRPQKIIINLHSNKINWKSDKSYLKRENDKVKYYFQWCHHKGEEREESYTSREFLVDLERVGYDVVKERILPKDISLASNYELYFLSLRK